MKVTLERATLLRSLGHVHRIVERRTTIPILSNILLRTGENALHLKATDLDIEVTEAIAAEVVQGGATTVPAYVIHDIVRKLPEGAQVSLETSDEGNQIVIRSGRSRFVLQTLPETDFPNIAEGDFSHEFTIPAANLKLLIDKTQFAISTEETRYYLNGIFFHVLENNGETWLRSVATDGHRLARVDVAAPEGAAGMPGVIVSRKAVSEILKLVEDGTESIRVELSTAKIRLTFGTVVFTSKLIDGTYPDYQRVIPAGNDRTLFVERDVFTRAVDRVATMAQEKSRAIKLALSDGKLTLSVNNPDSGSASEDLEVDYDSPAMEIGFNAKYLLDIAGQLDADTAVFKFLDSNAPALIQNREGSAALYILMPMRV
ncbi:MAG: DNA polymerase III subunit beta [Methylobacteriaceae bacterium]|jgi:DNA polymerase-3 subunit beta|nr:DNA polymerase III subunit beta [Methylobacteriaceae bacterium]